MDRKNSERTVGRMTEEGQDGKVRVLMVDDDRKLCRLVREYLGPMGYEITAAHTGPEGLEKARNASFDAVILDVMLPGMDGFEVLRTLRRDSNVPVLMLTARGDETDRIVGLEMGADDYLPKTFSTRELLARLRAVTRRAQAVVRHADTAADTSFTVGPLRIDPAAREAFLGEEHLDLTPIEFDLLHALASAAGRVLSRDQLLDRVAGRDFEAFDRSVDVHVSSLRKKLGDDPRQPRFIRTVRSSGYLFINPLSEQC